MDYRPVLLVSHKISNEITDVNLFVYTKRVIYALLRVRRIEYVANQWILKTNALWSQNIFLTNEIFFSFQTLKKTKTPTTTTNKF